MESPDERPDAAPPADDVEARLDALQRDSERRRAELRALAVDLPQATSRRAVLAAMWRSIVEAPDKPLVARRVALKVLRAPGDLVRSLRR
jgi:hypothetical protein